MHITGSVKIIPWVWPRHCSALSPTASGMDKGSVRAVQYAKKCGNRFPAVESEQLVRSGTAAALRCCCSTFARAQKPNAFQDGLMKTVELHLPSNTRTVRFVSKGLFPAAGNYIFNRLPAPPFTRPITRWGAGNCVRRIGVGEGWYTITAVYTQFQTIVTAVRYINIPYYIYIYSFKQLLTNLHMVYWHECIGNINIEYLLWRFFIAAHESTVDGLL